MFESTADDDDAFFAPVSSSNLASLFGIAVTKASTSGNASLTYTAPKQPNKSDEVSKSTPKHQSSVIIFKEIQAFKLIEKNYSSQGKCGFAIIGNDNIHIYQLLLYKQKNDIISTTKLYSQFQFIVQKDNYASFCDDHKQSWTIHFNSESDLNEFSHTVESRGGKIINNTITETKLSTSPKINTSVDKESPKQIDSDNQSDNSGNNAKANILSRMAKMGQKLLPNTSISDGTDSDTDKDKTSINKNRKPKRTTTEISNKPSNLISNRAMSIPVRQQPLLQQYTIVNGQYVPLVQPQFVPMSAEVNPADNLTSPMMYSPAPSNPYDQFQMYFTENRTHNSEVRMNILRLTNKMEEMLEKVQKMELKPGTNAAAENLLSNENEHLKSMVKHLENETQSNKKTDENRYSELLEIQSSILKENEELKKSFADHLVKENEYIQKITDLESKIHEQSTSLQQYKESNESKLFMDKKKYENIDENIKKIMSTLYSEMNSQFSDDESVQGRDVKAVLKQKIVDNTYNIIAAVSELNLTEPNENVLQ